MKSKAAAFWCVLSLVLATGLVVQWNYNKKQRMTLEKLQLHVEQSVSEPGTEARIQELERERNRYIGELRAAEFELNAVRMSAAAMNATNGAVAGSPPQSGEAGPGNEGAGGMGKMLSNMLKDPDMRKAMEHQQRVGMDMMYGSLFKQLKLTPEQEEKFKEMLLAQQMDNMSNASAMFDGNADRTKVAQELAEKTKAKEEQLKELLGEEKFAQYQEYNQTIGERMMLEQFARGAELSPDQNEQLLAMIREEKRNVQADFGGQQFDPTKDWQEMVNSEEVMQRFYSQQEEVNERVLQRAAELLTPEQIKKLGPVLKNQIEMQKAGMNMAKQMLKSSGGQDPGPGAPPTRQQ
ncbi:MAG TPA: hypothetical protein VF773_23060 [Verrucomicrobiae bacterium]